MKRRFTLPLRRLFFRFALPYPLALLAAAAVPYVQNSPQRQTLAFAAMIAIPALKIAFAVYLLPLFMLALVHVSRELAAAEGSWIEAAEPVAEGALPLAAWQAEDGAARDKAWGAEKPVDEELDDGSNRRVKVYNFEQPGASSGRPGGKPGGEGGI